MRGVSLERSEKRTRLPRKDRSVTRRGGKRARILSIRRQTPLCRYYRFVSPKRLRSSLSFPFTEIEFTYSHRRHLGFSGGPSDGNLPSGQEKVATTKAAPIGLQEPIQSSLNRVSCSDPSEFDRFAMRTARREQPHHGADHNPPSASAALSGAGPAAFRTAGFA